MNYFDRSNVSNLRIEFSIKNHVTFKQKLSYVTKLFIILMHS
jgi:hypothetical protein